MTTDEASPAIESAITTFEVDPSRLADGTYDHEKDRESGRGDINASYSADVIGGASRVRRPFRFAGELWITVGMQGFRGVQQATAFRLVSRQLFAGQVTSYHEKTGTADVAQNARNDAMGFYHGIAVKCGKELCVLSGPAGPLQSPTHK